MKWQSDSEEVLRTKVEQWRRWFAWYPVRIGENLHWFETIERRKVLWLSFGFDGHWKYREIE